MKEPISYGEWCRQWEAYRKARSPQIQYAIRTRQDPSLFLAGPYVRLGTAKSYSGSPGDVLVEMPANRVLYKWKNRKWFKK